MFSNLLSQRHGIDQSMAGSVISAIIGHLTQQGEGMAAVEVLAVYFLKVIIIQMRIGWAGYNQLYQI